jgi:hypothetical protein
VRADLGVEGWNFSNPSYKTPLSRLTRLSCLFLICKGIHFWPLEAFLPLGVEKFHPSTPRRLQAE